MYPGAHALLQPNKSAIIDADTGRVVTYRELDERSIRLANIFSGAGLRRGDHVAFLSDNATEVFEIYWAALRSGLYVTGINHHLTPSDVSYIVNDCGARILIVSAATETLAGAVIDTTPNIELRMAFGGAVPGHLSYEEKLAGAATAPPANQPRGADLLYSSGTTGRPKGVKPALPERQVGDPGDPYLAVFGPAYGFGFDTVYYSSAPTYHAAPLRFGGVVHAAGGTVVTARKFDAETALATIEQYAVTHAQFVPTMFVRMLKRAESTRRQYDQSSLRTAVHAAAPCPIDVKRHMIEWWGPILHEYYSSTEGNGITLIDSPTWLHKPGSVGQAGLGTLHICAEDGQELAPGNIGRVFFERDGIAFTYHNSPDKTKSAQHPSHETWSTTGDLGYIDTDEFLYLTDRQAFVIISGGVNIYPQEIENCLALHPKVFDVAVIGVPDEEMGEQVKAVVQAAPGVEADDALARELIAYTHEYIARFKAPKSVDFTDALPRSATGKLVKGTLTQQYLK